MKYRDMSLSQLSNVIGTDDIKRYVATVEGFLNRIQGFQAMRGYKLVIA